MHLTVTMAQPMRFEMALRIPSWCRNYRLEINGTEISATLERGYAVIERDWHSGDEVTLTLAMPIERMMASPHIRQDVGCVALQHGPIVYCLEEADNGAALANVTLSRDARLTQAFDDSLFGGVATISDEALRIEPVQWSSELYQSKSSSEITRTPFMFKAIPYCFWANRQPGEMRVWIYES